MKTKFIMALSVLCLILMSVKPMHFTAINSIQEMSIVGVYDGNEGYGYNFIAQHKEDDSEYTMTFQKVSESVSKEFDLDGEVFLNQKFEVTYTVKKVVTKDENGFDEEEEIFTIVRLKAI
ncbi:hypothetical protein BXY82_0380 [Gelidibacter sediminis]|uniref:Uncharacterized protein n=1 Tax=Gelidibacter sediminis TaxID=1608710 RepID=A0A4R7Q5Z0_9FLAO|nr:hypothetical protein [Gelidibacter sediminis]TDU42975.1 hypothetical protein BXY82_0380 [Gelidibacter sediminis]